MEVGWALLSLCFYFSFIYIFVGGFFLLFLFFFCFQNLWETGLWFLRVSFSSFKSSSGDEFRVVCSWRETSTCALTTVPLREAFVTGGFQVNNKILIAPPPPRVWVQFFCLLLNTMYKNRASSLFFM